MDKSNIYDLLFLIILTQIIIILFIAIFGLSNIITEIIEALNIQQYLITAVKKTISTLVKTIDNYI